MKKLDNFTNCLPTFIVHKDTLVKKLNEAESDWQ